MFSFIKRKPQLKDLIIDGFIDIHSHLLPGIDDGSKTIESTHSLIQNLQNIGFSEFITTPHIMKNVWDNSRVEIEQKLSETKCYLKQNDITTSLKAGAEYLLDANLMELLATERLLTLKDNHVLIEMSYINPPIQLYEFIFELQIAGYTPVLAHPERYAFYHSNLKEYQKLKDSGCRFQLNLLSTVGYYGPGAAKVADHLLKIGLIDFTGSDVHHQKHIDFFDTKVIIKQIAPLKEAIANNIFFKSGLSS